MSFGHSLLICSLYFIVQLSKLFQIHNIRTTWIRVYCFLLTFPKLFFSPTLLVTNYVKFCNEFNVICCFWIIIFNTLSFFFLVQFHLRKFCWIYPSNCKLVHCYYIFIRDLGSRLYIVFKFHISYTNTTSQRGL